MRDESGEIVDDFLPARGVADGVLAGGMRGGRDGERERGAEAESVNVQEGEDGVAPMPTLNGIRR